MSAVDRELIDALMELVLDAGEDLVVRRACLRNMYWLNDEQLAPLMHGPSGR